MDALDHTTIPVAAVSFQVSGILWEYFLIVLRTLWAVKSVSLYNLLYRGLILNQFLASQRSETRHLRL